ncbi:MAG: hypothetical protein JW772_05225, partial [Candidatus Diapherotrites archaeon]|nr:hypothetical protein [Candidatus Diapherotrites archaeon]
MNKGFLLLGIALIFTALNVSAALITYTDAICNTGDANVTFFDGNTYYLNVDNNIDVEGCQLTLNPGTIIKLKSSSDGNTFLNITNNGVLKAQGTEENKIIFTSSDDNSVGTAVGASDGVPTWGDYNTAIFLSASAGVVPDANDLFDLNLGYGEHGLVISRDYGSIHDCNVHDFNIPDNDNGGGISIHSNIGSVYNNTVFANQGNLNAWGVGILIQSTGSIENFYNNTIKNNSGNNDGAIAVFGSVTNFYNNNIIDNTVSRTAGLQLNSGTITNFFGNTIKGNRNSGSTGAAGIYSSGTITNFYDNLIADNVSAHPSSEGGGIFVWGPITNMYNNIFKYNSAGNGGAIHVENLFIGYCVSTATISNLYNNVFFDNNANSGSGGAIDAGTCSQITNVNNNIFAYNTGTAVKEAAANAAIDSNFNAFWANDANTTGYTEGSSSIYLGATPFADDSTVDVNSDRNFLLNSYGQAQLTGRGNSSIGTDSFFQARTVRPDNRLDYNRSIGYHADQNSPYVNVIAPAVGNYGGSVSVDFNVSTSNFAAAAISALALSYNTVKAVGTSIISQALDNYTCSGSFPTLTQDVN